MRYRSLLHYLLFSAVLVFYFLGLTQSDQSQLLSAIAAREESLRRIVVLGGSTTTAACSVSRFVFISEFPYGRSGNNCRD